VYAFAVTAPTDHNPTRWRAIWVLYLSGCTLALHIGKLPVALPALVQQFNMSLVQAGNLVSIYSVLIAAGGLLCGLFVARVGFVLFAAVGVSLCLLGSLAGAFSGTVFMLMLTRAVEGLGWIMGVVAIPVIMSTLCTEKDRPLVMGLWGAFMAVGAGTMLLLGPYLQSLGGWRLSWIVAACLSGAGAIATVLVCHFHRHALAPLVRVHAGRRNPGSTLTQNNIVQSRGISLQAAVGDLFTRRSMAVFLCFLFYSFQYVCVTSFLPTLLVADSDMPLGVASRWTAFIVIPNAIGNIGAGWLLNRGIKRSTILSSAAVLMGGCALFVLSIPDTTVRILAALVMTGIGGIIPGTLFSTASLVASSAAGVGVIIGFMLSGAGIGQLLGPVLLTRVVEWSGHWYAGGVLCFVAGVVGAYFARWLAYLPAVTRKG